MTTPQNGEEALEDRIKDGKIYTLKKTDPWPKEQTSFNDKSVDCNFNT
jgi:hypothetical protein